MFTKDQEGIYDGLKEIGPSISNFYADAVRLVDSSCTLASKANLIAHMAREIDSGLRSVFAPDFAKKEKLQIVGNDRGHFASILAAVGKDDPENLLAKEWFVIATTFPKVAHREAAHEKSKETDQILDLWTRYEKILSVFIGSFYAITNRLDIFLSYKTPPKESLPALNNILKNEKHSSYFFGKLQEPEWILSLKQEGYFDVQNAPKKIENSSSPDEWFALRSLVNISKQENVNIEAEIKNISDNIMAAYIDEKLDLHPFSVASIAQIIINLPVYSFSVNEQAFFEKVHLVNTDAALFFNTFLIEGLPKKLIKNNDIDSLLHFMSFLFGFSIYEEPGIDFGDIQTNPTKRRKPNVEEHQITQYLKNYGKDVTQLLGCEGVRIVINKLKQLDLIENYEISSFAIPSIEETDQTNYSHGWEKQLINYVRDFSSFLLKHDLSKIIDELLFSKTSILQRLAFHLIRVNFEEHQNKWWDFIQANEDLVYIHEPYILIKETSAGFDTDHFIDTIEWIKKSNRPHIDESIGQTKEKAFDYSNYRIRRWLTALVATTKENVELLNKTNEVYNALNNWEISHPEFDGYSSFSTGPDMPIEPLDFAKLSLLDQITYLKTYVPQHPHDTSEEGLSSSLQFSVFNSPDKYLFNLDSFIEIKSVFLEGLLDGLTNAIKKDKIVDFTPVINFISKKIRSHDFFEELKYNSNYKRGFIYRFIDFCIELSNKDSQFEFSTENLKQINELLILLLETDEFKDKSDNISNGYINYSLNSLPGRLHIALLDITLLYSRLYTKEEDKVKWPMEVEQYFKRNLTRFGNTGKDYSIFLGSRLPVFLYLDSAWVYENIKRIFPLEDEQQFEYTFGSALSGLYRPSKDMYNLFKENNFFNIALNRYVTENGALDTTITYGLLEWQFWNISLEDPQSIINEIIQRKISGQINQLIDISCRRKILSYQNIKKMWGTLLETINGQPLLETCYSRLIWLAELTITLDAETVSLITLSIAQIDKEDRSVYGFMRHIYKVADTNLNGAALIILQLFERKIVKPYFDHDLTLFVEKVYNAGLKKEADGICICVSATGSLALKDIYNKNN